MNFYMLINVFNNFAGFHIDSLKLCGLFCFCNREFMLLYVAGL